MPLDPQTGKWVDVGMSAPSGPYSQGHNAPPIPDKELHTASKRLVAEAQMAMKPTITNGQVSATPGGKKSDTARLADANSAAAQVFGKDSF